MLNIIGVLGKNKNVSASKSKVYLLMFNRFTQRRKGQRPPRVSFIAEICGVGKAERAERSGLPRFFFGYFLCSNDKESNNKTSRERSLFIIK